MRPSALESSKNCRRVGPNFTAQAGVSWVTSTLPSIADAMPRAALRTGQLTAVGARVGCGAQAGAVLADECIDAVASCGAAGGACPAGVALTGGHGGTEQAQGTAGGAAAVAIAVFQSCTHALRAALARPLRLAGAGAIRVTLAVAAAAQRAWAHRHRGAALAGLLATVFARVCHRAEARAVVADAAVQTATHGGSIVSIDVAGALVARCPRPADGTLAVRKVR